MDSWMKDPMEHGRELLELARDRGVLQDALCALWAAARPAEFGEVEGGAPAAGPVCHRMSDPVLASKDYDDVRITVDATGITIEQHGRFGPPDRLFVTPRLARFMARALFFSATQAEALAAGADAARSPSP